MMITKAVLEREIQCLTRIVVCVSPELKNNRAGYDKYESPVNVFICK